MKILFVIPYFAPAWGFGGPVRLAYDYARGLVKAGHEVAVFTSDVLDERSRVEKKKDNLKGIKVHYLLNLSNFLAWKKIFLPLKFPNFLKDNIKNFDLIHCFDFRTFQNIWVHHFAKEYKKPYVVSVLGQTGRGAGGRRSIKKSYDLLFGKRILRDASLVFAQNDHEEEDLENFGVKKGKIALLPLALDFSEFKTLPKRGAFRQKYGLTENDFLILFVGRIHYLKGIDFLIKALPAIRKKIKNVKLAIVGRDDGDVSRLKNIAKEIKVDKQVIFTGPIYGKERIKAYQDADVFAITPRLFEETSLASLEAAATGTPIIVNQRCRVPYLEDFQAGITLEDERPENIAKAIEKIFAEKEEMGKMAKKMVQEKFDVKKVAEMLEGYYYQVTQ